MQPDWIERLRDACKHESQTRIAQRLGYSSTVISQVLSGKYAGRTDLVEDRVRMVLMTPAVECPVLGEIAGEHCSREQRRPFAATNPTRVAVWRACRAGCPNSQIPEEDA